jgi:hypothetical protein
MLAVVLDSVRGFISVLDELGNVFAVVGTKPDSDSRVNSRLFAVNMQAGILGAPPFWQSVPH